MIHGLILYYGEVSGVDLNNKQIHFDDKEPLSYDWLVIGLGCVDSYHGIVGAKEYSSSIQTLAKHVLPTSVLTILRLMDKSPLLEEV